MSGTCEVTPGVTPGFPARLASIEQALLLLLTCVGYLEIEDTLSSCIPFSKMKDHGKVRARCIALKPPGFPCKIHLASNTNTSIPVSLGGYLRGYRLFKVIYKAMPVSYTHLTLPTICSV